MMRDADGDLFRWQLRADGSAPPGKAAAALKLQDIDEQRRDQLERYRQFAEPYIKADGTRGNMADLIPQIAEMNRQIDLKLPDMNRRELVRLHLAHAIETKVLPLTDDGWLHSLPDRLRNARKDFCIGFRPADGRKRIAWENKVGLSRLCPSDARDDSNRLARRIVDPILELKKNGCQVTYGVLTLPNYQPGKLRHGIKFIYKKFNGLLKKRRNKKPLFPNVIGAMCVLEAPLGWDRTWNVHLNVILVHRGFLDWRTLQEEWKYGCHFERIKGGREELERALREVIKYSARAVAEKSQCPDTATSGNSALRSASADASSQGAGIICMSADASPTNPLTTPLTPLDARDSIDSPTIDTSRQRQTPQTAERAAPPAMCDWTGQELLEWLTAFRGFRRTRTYKQLFRLAKPEPDSLSGYIWVGTGKWVEKSYRTEVGPLFSIPGDKSTTPDALERYFKFLSRLKPHPPPNKCERFA